MTLSSRSTRISTVVRPVRRRSAHLRPNADGTGPLVELGTVPADRRAAACHPVRTDVGRANVPRRALPPSHAGARVASVGAARPTTSGRPASPSADWCRARWRLPAPPTWLRVIHVRKLVRHGCMRAAKSLTSKRSTQCHQRLPAPQIHLRHPDTSQDRGDPH